jgi:hypothetical protein
MGKHASTKGVSNANQLCCTEADGRKRIGGFMASEPAHNPRVGSAEAPDPHQDLPTAALSSR